MGGGEEKAIPLSASRHFFSFRSLDRSREEGGGGKSHHRAAHSASFFRPCA